MKAVLIICDAYESPENNMIAQSVRVDLATVTQFLNLLEKRSIVKVDKTILQGKNASLENVNNTLKNIKLGADDIVFVFFSGHGGMEKGKSFLLTSDEKTLWRTDLQNLVNAQNVRLKMIMTDACNNEVGELSVSRSLSRGAGNAQEGDFDNIYKTLLHSYEGMMHLSSSSEGEFAWSDSNLGGFFTHYFIREGLIKKPTDSWEEIFKMAKDKTAQMYERIPATQRSELASQGIKSQTAKAISLPNLKKGSVNNNNQNANNQQVVVDKTPKAFIENKTPNAIEIYVADGVMQQWKTLKIDAKGKIELPIKNEYITLGFDSEGEEIYYDLEAGNFLFDKDEEGYLDLFEAQDAIRRGIGTIVTTTGIGEVVNESPYNSRLTAFDWAWEDVDGTWMIVSYHKNGVYEEFDENGEKVTVGKWEVLKEKVKGKNESLLVETEEDEEGNVYQTKYLILDEDEEMMQLVFYEAFENGEKIDYSSIVDEDFDPVLVMYKAEK
ncbi:MAG: hypothetical protein OHK0038_24170 [Flammeovirgaceae bacterium]